MLHPTFIKSLIANIKITLTNNSSFTFSISFETSFKNCKLTALQNELPLVYVTHNLSVKVSIKPGRRINESVSSLFLLNILAKLTFEIDLT